MRKSNGFEYWNRQRKAERLEHAIDLHLDEHGIPRDRPGLAAALARWPRHAWLEIAARHGINEPSDETIGVTLKRFRDRAEHAAKSQRRAS